MRATWRHTITLNMWTKPAVHPQIGFAPSVTGKNWSVRTLPTVRNRSRKSCKAGSTVPGTAKTLWTRGLSKWDLLMRQVRLGGEVCSGCNYWLRREPSARHSSPLRKMRTRAPGRISRPQRAPRGGWRPRETFSCQYAKLIPVSTATGMTTEDGPKLNCLYVIADLDYLHQGL
jgi:hypothetical protein